MKKLICLLLIVFLFGCVGEKTMAIEFTGASGQYVKFPASASINNLAQKTITFFTNLDGYGNNGAFLSKSFTDGWEIFVITPYAIAFTNGFDGASDGSWNSPNVYSFGTLFHVAITYDRTNVANDPKFYIAGVEVTVSEYETPIGSASDDSAIDLHVGTSASDTSYTMDGKLQDVRIYNRILTPQEIKILAASRAMNVIRNGLVFHAPFIGAQNKQIFAGVLAAGDKLRDIAGGLEGVPSGNPIAVPNTIQRINGGY